MCDAFTEDDDFVKRARADHWFQAGPGSLVQTPDGQFWTVVYNNLDGYGVIEGDHPKYIGAEDETLPKQTHMLRTPYTSCELPCIGELVRIFRRVKADGTILDYRREIETAPLKYRGYEIATGDSTPFGSIHFTIEDYDGAPDSGNRGKCGVAVSVEAAKKEIDAQIEEAE